ncbi:hypothetical protein [Pendulispora albinea]|uniref:Peptidoglycan binding-like domain-containing protein n=1 Tax=Pendulispora albinea TaxID=2741071 RepID=A0ABZ2MBI1_9BACT
MKENDVYGRFEGERGWILSDALGDRLIALEEDVAALPGASTWAREGLSEHELQRLLENPWDRRALLGAYEGLTGGLPWCLEDRDQAPRIAHRLVHAFEFGELVIFRLPQPVLVDIPFPKKPEQPPLGPNEAHDWLAVVLVDAQDRPVMGARCQIVLDGGASMERALDKEGRARFGALSGSTAHIDFPEIDASEWQPGITPSSAGRTHIVEQGDHVARLAAQSGFRTHKTIWNHPKNAKLVRLRASPNALLPGDELFIPEKKSKPTQRATNTEHRFTLQRDTVRLRVRITDGIGVPMAGARCAVDVGTVSETAALDGEGKLDEPMDASQGEGAIRVGDLVFPVSVGTLDPHDEASGIAARLINLGYDVSEPGEPDFEATLAWAIEEFQCDHGLKLDGAIAAVQDDLEKHHGC